LAGENSDEEEPEFEPVFDFYAQHFQRPLELHQMKAIQTLIEEGIKKKKIRTNRRTTTPVVLDA
jgi:hypothetical protein